MSPDPFRFRHSLLAAPLLALRTASWLSRMQPPCALGLPSLSEMMGFLRGARRTRVSSALTVRRTVIHSRLVRIPSSARDPPGPLVEMMGFLRGARRALVVVGSDSPQDCHSLPTCSNPFFCSGPSGSLGGDDGIRTHDPLLAGQVLSHLSYTPMGSQPSQVAVSATSYPPAPSPVQYYRHRRA